MTKFELLVVPTFISNLSSFNKSCDLFMITCSFSLMQRSHLLEPQTYGDDFCRISHEMLSMLGDFPLSFRSQKCCDSLVVFLFAEYVMLALWFPYLVLNVFSVSPIYCFWPLSACSVALYIIACSKHFPFRGHLSLFLQLQRRSIVCFEKSPKKCCPHLAILHCPLDPRNAVLNTFR